MFKVSEWPFASTWEGEQRRIQRHMDGATYRLKQPRGLASEI